MRWLLLLALCSSGLAQAGEWAGVPVDQAPALGLGSVTVSEVGVGWRAPLATGGFVAVEVFADAEAADAALTHRAATASNMAQPVLAVGDRAVGDGEAYALVRDENVLIRVRALAGGATAVVERVRSALVEVAPVGVSRELQTDDGVRRWDMVGREL